MSAFKLRRLTPDAVMPSKAHDGDAGWDVRSIESMVIRPGETRAVPTGLAVADYTGKNHDCLNSPYAPEIDFIKVEGRSGLALKGIFPVGGIIDPSYRGEIKIILHNGSSNQYVISVGDRIAQLLIYTVMYRNVFSEAFEESTSTQRGVAGFGSTGG